MYPVDADALAKMEERMRNVGYQLAEPVSTNVWNGQHKPVCVHGYLRVMAAVGAGLAQISMELFDDSRTSSDYSEGEEGELGGLVTSIVLRRRGREITDGGLMKMIEEVYEATRRDRAAAIRECRATAFNKPILSVQRIKDLSRVSHKKAQQAIRVLNHGDREIIDAVRDGHMSVKEAWELCRGQSRKEGSSKKPTRAALNAKPELVVVK